MLMFNDDRRQPIPFYGICIVQWVQSHEPVPRYFDVY